MIAILKHMTKTPIKMRTRGSLTNSLAVLVMLSCMAFLTSCTRTFRGSGGVEANNCEGEIFALEKEPNYVKKGIQRWESSHGCQVRLDVIMSRSTCFNTATDLIVGWPVPSIVRSDDDSFRVFVRDPNNRFQDRRIAKLYDGDGELPTSATDSGFRLEGRELWLTEDGRFAYLREGDEVEKWPWDEEPPGCYD